MSQNTFCWVDIPVSNLNRAVDFYKTVLDSEVETMSEHGFTFGLLPHADDNVSGCLAEMEDRKPSHHGPLVYLNVEGRLNEAVGLVNSAGGKVLKDPEQIGPWGHRALILDTEGNVIALYSKNA